VTVAEEAVEVAACCSELWPSAAANDFSSQGPPPMGVSKDPLVEGPPFGSREQTPGRHCIQRIEICRYIISRRLQPVHCSSN